MKIIHIKSQSSVALPIYTSDLNHLNVLENLKKPAATPNKKVRPISLSIFCSSRVGGSNNQLICFQGAAAKKQAKKNKTKDTKQTETSGEEEKKEAEEEGEDEEIPQLVPIDTPSKKPKLEVSAVHIY